MWTCFCLGWVQGSKKEFTTSVVLFFFSICLWRRRGGGICRARPKGVTTETYVVLNITKYGRCSDPAKANQIKSPGQVLLVHAETLITRSMQLHGIASFLVVVMNVHTHTSPILRSTNNDSCVGTFYFKAFYYKNAPPG